MNVRPLRSATARRPLRFDAADYLTLYAVLLFLVPANLIFEPLGALGTPANVVGLVAFGWYVATRMVPSLGIASGPQPLRIAVALVILSVLASYVAFGMRPAADVSEINAADMGVLLMFAWTGPALVAADGLMTRSDLDRLLKRVCVLAAVVASLGIIEFFTGFEVRSMKIPGLVPNHVRGSIAGTGIFSRVAGTATHPIEFGVVLAVILPIALHYLVAEPKQTARRWWVIAGLIGVAIPMALSRSAVISVAIAGLVLVSGWSWRMRVNAAAALFAFLVVMQAAIPGLLGTIRSLFVNLNNDDSIRGRTEDYDIVGRFIAERPFFGRGFQTFGTKYLTLDNQVLGIIIELGFVGLAAFLTFVAIAFFTARGARRRSRNIVTRNLAQALAAAVLAAFIGFLTFDVLGYAMISGTIFLVSGCAGALWRQARAEQETVPPSVLATA